MSHNVIPYSIALQEGLSSEIPNLSGGDVQVLCDFLYSMLQMDSEDRITPCRLLCHRWLADDDSAKYPEEGRSNTACMCGAKGICIICMLELHHTQHITPSTVMGNAAQRTESFQRVRDSEV